MTKQIIGWLLIALPFIVIANSMIATIGWRSTLAVSAIAVIFVACIWYGTKLVVLGG